MRHLKSTFVLRLAAGVLLVCAALAAGAARASAEGVRFEPAGGGFSVMFPATPEKRSEQENLGAFVLSISGYGLDHEGVGYFVVHFSLPPQAMSEPRMEEFLYTRMETEYAMLGKAAGGDVFSVAERSDITLGEFKGRQCVYNGSKAMGVVRGYKVGQRFYIVGVFGNKESFSAQRAVAFLDSFKLTGKNT